MLFAFTCTKPATKGFEAESHVCPIVTVTALIVGAALFSRMLTFVVENVVPTDGLKVTGFGFQVKPPLPELPTVKITVSIWERPVSVLKRKLPLYVPAVSCVVVVLQPNPGPAE